MSKLARLQAARAAKKNNKDYASLRPGSHQGDAPGCPRGPARRFCSYNGRLMLGNDSLAELQRSHQAAADWDKLSGSRNAMKDLLQHATNDPEGVEVQSRPPADDASVVAPSSQQHEVESKLSRASSKWQAAQQEQPYKSTINRFKTSQSDAGRSVGRNSEQKTKASSDGSKCPSIAESGTRRALEEYAKERVPKSNLKENILAFEDFERAYQESVRRMKGFNQERLAMISRNL